MSKKPYNKPEYTFDIDKMGITNKLTDLRQEGNYLIGLTEAGIRFRQHIPVGKALTKEGDKFVLKDRGCIVPYAYPVGTMSFPAPDSPTQ
ncbi:hypothetical protein [Candidatus Amarobacter glycogenicus]|uniref:hypothetical protein n=1 Tax=Candidatus Amarobacter glycogenicus TaxID=3140699 RepID=UPI003135FFB2|nr:hypothetical protein [Dehalococcoidia bacterium]